ncbi:MAG: hypothetical protein N3G21_08615, partial [Candidatus Hydrogenedentes bacterium]|nr:hypothetical protein [Candidatus Hydrogenedentota bacterium]
GYDNPFVGTFDGKGFTIENIYISLPTVPGEENGGIFSIVGETGVIKDLSLENAYIGGGYRYMGGIAGINFGLIVGCSVRGSIVSNIGAGGLVGSNKGVILDSHFLGNVTGSGIVGGIAGANDSDYGRSATIGNCYVLGKITLRGSSSAGGIAGWGRGGKVKNCYFSGEAYSDGDWGGIIGFSSGEVIRCYATGLVIAYGKFQKIGGVVGYNYDGNLIECYSSTRIFDEAREESNDIGGLLGYNFSSNTMEGCYWDVEVSGIESSEGGEGKTTSEMKQKSTYVGWDFENVWDIIEGETYPWLRSLGPTQEYVPTQNNRIYISTLEDLAKIGKDWNFPWDADYELTKDIDASETIYWNNREGFEPIFFLTGSLDGAGHKISNLYIFRIYSSSRYPTGLISYNLGHVKNLSLENCWVAGMADVGGLVGRNYGHILKCDIKGGVAGYPYDNTGGVVGFNGGVIELCRSSGHISGVSQVGGIAGESWSIIRNCYSLCDVRAARDKGGGITGY